MESPKIEDTRIQGRTAQPYSEDVVDAAWALMALNQVRNQPVITQSLTAPERRQITSAKSTPRKVSATSSTTSSSMSAPQSSSAEAGFSNRTPQPILPDHQSEPEAGTSGASKHKGYIKMANHARKYKCTTCPYVTKELTNIKKHVCTHTCEKPYKCQLCEYVGRQKYVLNYHTRTHHLAHARKMGLAIFECKLCGHNSGSNQDLEVHKRTHTGERPFKCGHSNCDKAFSDPRTKLKHERIHTGERPFKCEFCDKSFMWNHHLTSHMRIHTGEKPFKCVFCGKSFMWNHHLTSHMRIHTAERPFKCEFCGYTARQKGHLKTHIKSMHQKQAIPTDLQIKKTKTK